MDLSAWAPRLLSVLRIVAGLLFLEHGLSKLLQFPIPAPAALTTTIIAAGVIELVGGALVTLGLFTRLAAFIMSGEMAVAYFIAHAPQSFYPLVNRGESAILFCFIFLYIAAAGPGPWSIDAKRR
jgi:putative oxidoreductase